MFIKEVLEQSRRDFTAIYKCEHCGHEVKKGGYDDEYFHTTVVPEMKCKECDRASIGIGYVPRQTKYSDNLTV